MKLNYVIDRFALITGIKGEELSKWIPLCAQALEEVKLMATQEALRDEASCMRLSLLAGAYAYYEFTLYAGENPKTVTTGTLSITNFSEAKVKALELYEHEKAQVWDLLDTSKDFCFQRVSV